MVKLRKESFTLVLVILFLILGYGIYSFGYRSKGLTPTYKVKTSANVPEVDLSLIPEIDYNYLNNLWYDQKIEMLIVAPNITGFDEALEPLVKWKNEKGVKTIILSNFSLYEGIDDAEKIRNMIKSYYEKENIQWVLLAGDAQDDLIPIRKVYNPDVNRWAAPQTESVGGEYYKPTDFYYADLTGTWDSDEDGKWGEAPQDNLYGLDEISWIPEVYVGRFPAGNVDELKIMVNKTIEYESNPPPGNWTNRMLLAGAISDLSPLEDEAVLTAYISSNYVQNEMNFTHLHRTDSPFDPPTPSAPNRQENLISTNIKTEMDSGYSTVIIASHGIFDYFQDTYGSIFTQGQATTLSNTNMPFLFYGDACTTSSYDINNNSIGEVLIELPNAGAIGVIGALRVSWYFEGDTNLEMLNRGNAKLFWKEFFENKKFQQGKALYDSKVAYINSDYYKIGNSVAKGSTVYDFERKNILTYNLLGDPEVDIYTNVPKSAENPFVGDIYEGQVISTVIRDADGTPVPYARVHINGSNGKYYTRYADENGLVNLQMYTQKNGTFDVTITGHNLLRSSYNFTTLSDNDKPELNRMSFTPKKPLTTDKIIFDIEVFDNSSVIESAYLILSKNGFQSYGYYSQQNGLLMKRNNITIIIDQLFPGDYVFFVFVRDYANNTSVFYNDSFRFSIPQSIIDFILPVCIGVIIGIAGLSSYVLFKGIKKYSRIISSLS